MRVLNWFAVIALMLLVASFALRNSDYVVVKWLPGFEVEVQLVLALLCAFLLGLFSALLLLLPSWLRAQRDSSKAAKALQKAEKEAKQDNYTRTQSVAVTQSGSGDAV